MTATSHSLAFVQDLLTDIENTQVEIETARAAHKSDLAFQIRLSLLEKRVKDNWHAVEQIAQSVATAA